MRESTPVRRIVFAGTPVFATTIQLALLSNPSYRVIAVYTQPDRPKGRGRSMAESPVKQLATQHHLPVYQPERFDEVALKTALMLDADVMIVAAYGLMLPNRLLNHFPYGCINVHASLLPKWRGASPIQHAILAGDQETGVTIMQMNQGLDCGDILDQRACPITKQDTSEDLFKRLAHLGAKRVQRVLHELDCLTHTPQDQAKATYAPKMDQRIAHIDWRKPAHYLARLVRALHPKPGAHTHWRGQRIKIWEAVALPETTFKAEVGTLVRQTRDDFDIMTGQGVLRVNVIQVAGARKMGVRDFLNAHRAKLQIGKTQFGALTG